MIQPPSTPENGITRETAQPIRILHLTDFHFLAPGRKAMFGVDTEQSFVEVLAAALQSDQRPDLAVLTGDLVQDPEASAYENLRRRLSLLPCPAYCLPGNHDDPTLMVRILAQGNVFCQPQILLEHWQIICLDSTVPGQAHGCLAAEQLELLSALLGEYPQRHALIALHHHPVASGSPWMDTMLLENAERFFEVLAQHEQARGVVFGHVHQEMDRRHRGLRIFSSPSTCFQFKPRQRDFALDPLPPGYRWIELHPDGRIESSIRRTASLPEGLNKDCHGY